MRSLTTIVLLAALIGGCAADGAGSTATESELTEAKVLLDCTVFESGGGPDQQVTVLEARDGSLSLRELTNHGSTESRPLTREEWESHDLRLRRDRWDTPDTISRLYKDGNDWINESKGGGFSVFGYAACDP